MGCRVLQVELDTARLVGLMEMEQAYDAGCIALNESLENQ